MIAVAIIILIIIFKIMGLATGDEEPKGKPQTDRRNAPHDPEDLGESLGRLVTLSNGPLKEGDKIEITTDEFGRRQLKRKRFLSDEEMGKLTKMNSDTEETNNVFGTNYKIKKSQNAWGEPDTHEIFETELFKADQSRGILAPNREQKGFVLKPRQDGQKESDSKDKKSNNKE
jgi:hypothetical protein